MHNTETSEPTVTLNLDVSIEYLANVICSGVEGGISYWCDDVAYTPAYRELTELPEYARDYAAPFFSGKITFMVRDDGGEYVLGKREHILDEQAVRRAIQVIATKYPHHLGAVLGHANKQDAETGDVLIQCALFGELVFG